MVGSPRPPPTPGWYKGLAQPLRFNMVEPVSFGLSKGLQKSSSKNNLAAMAGANYSGSTGLLKKPSGVPTSKKEGGAPTLLKRSRSMGTFGHYVNFGQQAVEEISGKSSIGASGEVEVEGSKSAPVAGSTDSAAPSASSTTAAANPTPSSAVQSAVPTSTDHSRSPSPTPSSPTPNEDTPELVDDNNLHHMPMARVDYFSHEWNESDLAGSWRYIVSRRQDMANSARLENASWRTWAKAKYNLKTVRPETVNWLKDYDVTWLYGPLYHERSSTDWDKAEPINPIQEKKGKKADSIKSILKKKTIAEIMLEDTPDYKGPTENYLRHHNYRQITDDQTNIAKVVNSQYTQPQTRAPTPEPEDKHVHFNARVEQCISLDPEEIQQQQSDSGESDSESEEGGLFLGIQRSTNSSNTSLSSRTIAPLPATTLNMPDDAEEEDEEPQQHITGTRNYDYNSVYTNKAPAFKIVDPKVQAVELPQSVQRVMSKTNVDEEKNRQPSVSFGCK